MTTEIVKHDGKQFLKVALLSVTQKEQSFYLAKMLASDFIKIYTVRPAEYDFEKHSSLAKSFPEESEYYQHLINEDREKIDQKDFQREADSGRINSIIKYLQNEEYAFFPNTIIVNCELINNWEEYRINEDNTFEEYASVSKSDFLSFLKKDNDRYILYIPFMERSVLVIDGQHRLEGIKNSSQKIQESFELVLAFIIGYDRSVVAKQFYTINYEQKPVNKSLLYQLTGEFSLEINELSFMHNVVKLLNELPDSPFFGRIKMLGKTPRSLDAEAKKKLSISQAFLIDSMIRFVSVKAKGTMYPPIYLKYFKDPSHQILIIRSLARYFSAVRALKPDWEHPDTSLLSKGMAVGALLKVLNFLFPIIFTRELSNDWSKIDSLKVENYKAFLSGLENVDFSATGPYGKTSSEGGLGKLKNDILINLKYIGHSDIKEFERTFKTDYLMNFNNAL